MARCYVLPAGIHGSVFAELPRMVLLILAAVMLCALAGWFLLSFGAEAAQALLVVALMVITWHMARRRPHMTISDDFKAW